MTVDASSVIARINAELASRELQRRNLLPFIQRFHPSYQVGWVHRSLTSLLDSFMQMVADKQSPRLIINVCPRVGKSCIVSEFFPAFCLGHHPEWEMVGATYNQTIADNFGRKVRTLINTPEYLDLFPALQLDDSANAMNYIATTSRGSYTAVGMGGGLTSKGAHVLLIDDPTKDREEADSLTIRTRDWDWYTSVARTRLMPGGGIIVIQTRWHVDDLTGRLLAAAKENEKADQWVVYSFPAIAVQDEKHRKKGEAIHPERYPLSELEQIRASIPARDWEALYQCSPFVADGAFFKLPWFKFDGRPDEDGMNWIVCADYATSAKATADHTAIGAFGMDHKGHIHADADPVYGRLEPADAVRRTIRMMKRRGTRLLVAEKGQISNLLKPIFRMIGEEEKWPVNLETGAYARNQSKAVTANAFAALMEMGKIHFPKGWWQDVGKGLMLRFSPDSDGEDDLIDMCSGVGVATTRSWFRPPAPPLPEIPEPFSRNADWLRRRTQEASSGGYRRLNGSLYDEGH